MPIYEYYCETCDAKFERLRPMSAAGQPFACPTCGGQAQAAVSRLARVSGRGEEGGGEGGAEDFGGDFGGGDFGGGDFGHGHSHGPGGHTH